MPLMKTENENEVANAEGKKDKKSFTKNHSEHLFKCHDIPEIPSQDSNLHLGLKTEMFPT